MWDTRHRAHRDSAVEQRLVLSHCSRKGVLSWSCGSSILRGIEYFMFPQPGHLPWLRASTETCDGRIKECTVGKVGQADDPNPSRETLASTAL